MTAEQLEEARAERMRQNGHAAITIEDVRTWIEETGLCIFLPRSAQAGQGILPAPTFLEAVAGQRVNEPTLELIAEAESLLVRLEAEGVAVRLNLSGHAAGSSSDQPDYVVAGWVLPYIYALRGDRDWRRSPQLTGSRQVSQLAVQAAKQLDSANLNAGQLRDALGREVTEAAVLRALHELWKQLRIIPVVPEMGQPALWQPLRQRFQKAIAEGASTSQVTAISVLASIYLQAVIAASMEDVEMFLSPLTSRSKIREVVRGLAATRQVHSTTMGHSPMYYVAGTLPDFPAVPSFQISSSSSYRSGNYRSNGYRPNHNGLHAGHGHEEEVTDYEISTISIRERFPDATLHVTANGSSRTDHAGAESNGHNGQNGNGKPLAQPTVQGPLQTTVKVRAPKAAPPRPRAPRAGGSAGDRRRAPAPRGLAGSNGGARSFSQNHGSSSNGNASKPGSMTSGGNGSKSTSRSTVSSRGGQSRSGQSTSGNGLGNGLSAAGANDKPLPSSTRPVSTQPSGSKRQG